MKKISFLFVFVLFFNYSKSTIYFTSPDSSWLSNNNIKSFISQWNQQIKIKVDSILLTSKTNKCLKEKLKLINLEKIINFENRVLALDLSKTNFDSTLYCQLLNSNYIIEKISFNNLHGLGYGITSIKLNKKSLDIFKYSSKNKTDSIAGYWNNLEKINLSEKQFSKQLCNATDTCLMDSTNLNDLYIINKIENLQIVESIIVLSPSKNFKFFFEITLNEFYYKKDD